MTRQWVMVLLAFLLVACGTLQVRTGGPATRRPVRHEVHVGFRVPV